MGRGVSAPVVSLRDVALRRSERFELSVPALDLGPGITAVVGPNGGGKSTLLRVIATVMAADRGSVSVGGFDPSTDSGLIAVRRSLGHLPQDDSVPRRLRVFDHVDLVAVMRELAPDERRRRAAVARALDDVGMLGLAHERCARLSGGQRRLVALAAALAGDARLLVLDEPDASLDDEHRSRLGALLLRRATTSTIIVATHDQPWIDSLGARRVEVIGGVSRAA
jgi:ABC-2 type transport system ATP-binding protein